MANIKISPAQLPATKTWKDGMTYSIHVRQIGPGDFEIINSHPIAAKKSAAADNPDAPAMGTPPSTGTVAPRY